MENKIFDVQDANSITAIRQKNEIGLPIIALGLDLLPVLILMNQHVLTWMSASALLFVLLLPIAGLITGVVSLSRGKGRISKAGKIISIIAIALPLALVALIIAFFIGVTTGVISLM
jgi:dolichyl-phosphate-mannose--protein O-mannosyl transferase